MQRYVHTIIDIFTQKPSYKVAITSLIWRFSYQIQMPNFRGLELYNKKRVAGKIDSFRKLKHNMVFVRQSAMI